MSIMYWPLQGVKCTQQDSRNIEHNVLTPELHFVSINKEHIIDLPKKT